jgi:hypothetical protein
MKNGIICVVYADDTIFAGTNGEELEEVIAGLGVQFFSNLSKKSIQHQ